MTTTFTRLRSPVLRCSGVILNHHNRWWLAEFPRPGGGLPKIRRLTGQLTSAMAQTLDDDRASTDAPSKVGDPYPSNLCWAGLFYLVPSDRSPDIFDVEACLRCAEADIPEVPLARVAIESTLFPLPSSFVSVLTAFPKEDRPVLAIRLSGYTCATFELLTVRYMLTYRPKSPWRDISNDAVGDSGSDILGWRYVDDWIKPA